MRLRYTLWTIVALCAYGSVSPVWAYDLPGDSPRSGGCSGITFSEFMPTQFSQDHNNVEVPPESEFSFLASKATFPGTITVTIKGESVPVTVVPHFAGFQVTGKLPATIKGAFARITITGKGGGQCEHSDGWLLKVAE